MAKLIHRLSTTDNVVKLELEGNLRIDRLAEFDEILSAIKVESGQVLEVHCALLRHFDLSCAGVFLRHINLWRTQPFELKLINANLPHLEFLEKLPEAEPVREDIKRNAIVQVFFSLGYLATSALQEMRFFFAFVGRTTDALWQVAKNPTKLRVKAIMHHMQVTGVAALPIVCLIAFLISVVLAYQGVQQLRIFGAEIFTVDLVAISVLREMGILLTAIMVAGRSGSAFAAELGVMQINEETDAIRTMGLEPFQVLVLPRVIALVLVMPLLTFAADMMGLLGGAILSMNLIDISPQQYMGRIQDAVTVNTFLVGLLKAPVFGGLIAIVGTMRGMQARGSASEVGSLTTVAVVQSIFMVILADALFSILFSALKI